ncbi:hypothetical protein [Streptomyces sp. NPDC001410]|uniref:hypothetical protein n=1 Tax=Streptomyces sp. NPDC001410 TaxID=3364574 RepID=UPI0036A3CA07
MATTDMESDSFPRGDEDRLIECMAHEVCPVDRAELTTLAAALAPAAAVPDVRADGIGVRLGMEGVIPVSDLPNASSGPDTAVDENRLEELIIEAQTALPVELPTLANRCASALGLGTALVYLVDL